jgi:predicted TIM-barrel fold metal-dependent hydrolase
LADFDKLDIKPDVRNKILKDNAAGLLGLTQPSEQDRTSRGLG